MKTVLLLEDNDYDARLISRVLEHHGYRVCRAGDGESGLQMATEERPDLILLDLGLPDLDGQTVAALFRTMPELARVPLVAVTAWPPDTAAQMAQAYGCDGYISKPIRVVDFPTLVDHYLDN